MLELITRTVPVDDFVDPYPLLDPADPLLWWRDDEGMLGIGRALTLTFSGPERFAQARRVWTSICETAQQHGPAAAPGTGLTAFGTFAFDDTAAVPSVLIVPSLVISRHDGRSWATRVVKATDSPADEAPLDPDRIQADVARLRTASAARQHARRLPEQPEQPEQQSRAVLRSGHDAQVRHVAAVRRALDLIEKGRLQKVVVARPAHADLPAEFDLPTVLARLGRAYPTCWGFSVDGFFGASPETLIESHGGQVHARVLAGTRPRTPSSTPDALERELQSDPKERQEHALASQSVLESLAPHVHHMTATGPFALSLPNVSHLATDVDAELTDASDVLALVAAVHPTAAVAGVPRETALQAIGQIEQNNRARYAGPVGWVNATGDGEWAIGLRSAQRLGDTLTAWAGGGIVAGSRPEQEFAETEAKLQPIRQALAG